MLKIKSSTLPFISLTRLLGGSFLLLRSRNRLDVFKLPRPPESRVQSPEGCEGVASKGAGRSLPQPEARELSLKRDNRNTRRVLKQHQRDEHLLGVLRQQVLPRPQEGCGCGGGGNQRSRKFFSRTRRRRHTLLETAKRKCNKRT